MLGELQLKGALPGIDLVEETGQPALAALAVGEQLVRPEQLAMVVLQLEPIDDREWQTFFKHSAPPHRSRSRTRRARSARLLGCGRPLPSSTRSARPKRRA